MGEQQFGEISYNKIKMIYLLALIQWFFKSNQWNSFPIWNNFVCFPNQWFLFLKHWFWLNSLKWYKIFDVDLIQVKGYLPFQGSFFYRIFFSLVSFNLHNFHWLFSFASILLLLFCYSYYIRSSFCHYIFSCLTFL